MEANAAAADSNWCSVCRTPLETHQALRYHLQLFHIQQELTVPAPENPQPCP